MESLKTAASKADVGGMTLQDALCMMLVAGIRDTRLKEKLSELEEPTLPAFTTLNRCTPTRKGHGRWDCFN